MKSGFGLGLSLYIALGLLAVIDGRAFRSEAAGAAPPGPSPSGPVPATNSQTSGIVLVPSLAKPANAQELQEKDFAGYLLVYFKDQTHSAYFAISRDGYTFTDVNKGRPIFDGAALAEQKGVRDPSISRGPDGAFYLAMTDLHVNGQRAGYRTNQWERPEPQYGWGNNRALVMMKSWDLVHWTHSDFRIDKAFPELAEIGCCWAPAMIFDEAKGQMLISFTMKIGRGVDRIYYAYTDDAFSKMETKPEVLFTFPVPDGTLADNVRDRLHVIDSDISKVGAKFHLFYSSKETGTPGIEHSVSDKINQGYKLDQKRVDPERVSCEAPNLFKRLGTSTYVLMYDAYGAGNMGFSETTDFVTYTNIGRFNEGVMKTTNFIAPKHGAVTHLTLAELKALAEYWKVDIKLD
jgi:hypothetical protein